MTASQHHAVKLRDLLAQPQRSELTRLFVASDSVAVRGVTLISDIEAITSVGPDMIIVLSADVARGSWMVAAALRYAWERHAAALIIPDRSLNPSVVQLAERFELSLFATPSAATDVALEVATQFGFASAQLVSSLHQFTQLVDDCEDISGVLGLAATLLQDAEVTLESSGAVVRAAGGTGDQTRATAPARSSALPHRVSVPVGSGAAQAGLLVVNVDVAASERARAVLEACATKLRALLAEAQLTALQRSLPPVSLATLGGSDARLPLDPAVADAFEWAEEPGWSGDGGFVSVCMLSAHHDRYGAALHQLWLAEFPECPLVQGKEGWLAFVPLAEREGHGDVAERLRARLPEIHLLDLRVGVSAAHGSPQRLRDSIREAWLAARIAEGGSASAIVSYRELPTRLLPQLLPGALATEVVELVYPELAADPARAELIELLCTYASTLGSAVETARRLGIHRNTVSQRLTRLHELGVPVHDPAQALGVHLLFAASVDA